MGKTGENNISVTYAGSNSYISSEASTTVEVSKTESVIIIDSLGTINKGDNVTISGKITDKNNNAIANAQVKITINGSPKTVKSDSNGVFVYNYIMNRLGDNDITVIFNGNNNFLATNTTSIVNVVKAS